MPEQDHDPTLAEQLAQFQHQLEDLSRRMAGIERRLGDTPPDRPTSPASRLAAEPPEQAPPPRQETRPDQTGAPSPHSAGFRPLTPGAAPAPETPAAAPIRAEDRQWEALIGGKW